MLCNARRVAVAVLSSAASAAGRRSSNGRHLPSLTWKDRVSAQLVMDRRKACALTVWEKGLCIDAQRVVYLIDIRSYQGKLAVSKAGSAQSI